MATTIALFGEAEKGEFNIPYHCRTLPQLVDSLGNPPEDSRGLHYAVQVLLFGRDLLFFRVREEGFSVEDYLEGVHQLQAECLISRIAAIYMPGVGACGLLDEIIPICRVHHSLLIMDQADLYDYLTSS